MKKTRFQKPYTQDGRTKFPLRKKAGVYLIKNSAGTIVYIGSSESDIYKAMYHHFNTWNDRQVERATYNRNSHTVRVVYTTPNQAITLERALIKKYQPADNTQKYETLFNEIKEAQALENYFNSNIVAPF